jgi:hypothetical protein
LWWTSTDLLSKDSDSGFMEKMAFGKDFETKIRKAMGNHEDMKCFLDLFLGLSVVHQFLEFCYSLNFEVMCHLLSVLI